MPTGLNSENVPNYVMIRLRPGDPSSDTLDRAVIRFFRKFDGNFFLNFQNTFLDQLHTVSENLRKSYPGLFEKCGNSVRDCSKRNAVYESFPREPRIVLRMALVATKQGCPHRHSCGDDSVEIKNQ